MKVLATLAAVVATASAFAPNASPLRYVEDFQCSYVGSFSALYWKFSAVVCFAVVSP